MRTKRSFCYLLPETAGTRGANEIGTCIIKYFKSVDEKVQVTFVSYSCSGRNGKQYVCALVPTVQLLPFYVIEHKFFVAG